MHALLHFVALFGFIRTGPTCIRCIDVTDISECLQDLVFCGDIEQCYLEKIMKEDHTIRYNAGCRAKEVCRLMALVGRKKRETGLDAACCTEAPNDIGPCNAQLFGITQRPTTTQTTVTGHDRAGPLCMRCTGAIDISQCIANTVHCSSDEQCYSEKIITEDLSIRYNAGCRSNNVCSIMAMLNAPKKKRELISCAECCSTAPNEFGPCNAKLCGLTPVATPSCIVCDGVLTGVQSCPTYTICSQNQACYTGVRHVGTSTGYVFGCVEKQTCLNLITHAQQGHILGRAIHGDQGTKLCDACCVGDRCNAADCFQLKKNMTVADYS